MKILYVHRAKNIDRHSFEELFSSIEAELKKDVSIINYYQNLNISFFANISSIKKIDCDIIHLTGGLGFYAPFLPKRKTILTIHDTNHFEFDLKGLKKWIFGWLFFKAPSFFVTKITTVSNLTKNNLIHFFNIPNNKIIVIPNCYSNEFKTVIKKSLSEPIKILQIGTKSNKNIPRLIKAIQNLNVELTIIGKLNSNLITLLTEKKINYVNKFNLTRKEMFQEYIKTDIVAFVSLNEGFGMPIIEANAIGRIVISSNHSPMTEVANKTAFFVDPLKIDEIRAGILQLIDDSNLRSHLIDCGIKNAQLYTQNIVAEKYKGLYIKTISEFSK